MFSHHWCQHRTSGHQPGQHLVPPPQPALPHSAMTMQSHHSHVYQDGHSCQLALVNTHTQNHPSFLDCSANLTSALFKLKFFVNLFWTCKSYKINFLFKNISKVTLALILEFIPSQGGWCHWCRVAWWSFCCYNKI